MNYYEIIENNCKLHSPVKWWPRFAYHYTDVENAASILSDGFIYSRNDAIESKRMKNDNASRQVINMTDDTITGKVRFYFRPLTPTQYHNEGFKHPEIRYRQDCYANVPVPVFFLFDLNELLVQPGVQFSEKSQAGWGSELFSSPEEFEKMNFDKIYENGPMEDPEVDKKYRHAEIISQNSFPVDTCLKYVLCRNNIERLTLLNLLRNLDNRLFLKYKDCIQVCNNNLFYNNGIYLSDCRYYEGSASITIEDKWSKTNYLNKQKRVMGIDELAMLNAEIEFIWKKSRNILSKESCRFQIDYENSTLISFHGLTKPSNANVLYTKVSIEGKLMCYMSQQLSASALL